MTFFNGFQLENIIKIIIRNVGFQPLIAVSRKEIPVIISTGDGRYYVSETTTATRRSGSNSYVAIADHLTPDGYVACTENGTKYQALKEAYDAYTKLVTTGVYQDYKDTLPKK